MTTALTILFAVGMTKWAIAPVIIAAGISALSSLAGQGISVHMTRDEVVQKISAAQLELVPVLFGDVSAVVRRAVRHYMPREEVPAVGRICAYRRVRTGGVVEYLGDLADDDPSGLRATDGEAVYAALQFAERLAAGRPRHKDGLSVQLHRRALPRAFNAKEDPSVARRGKRRRLRKRGGKHLGN